MANHAKLLQQEKLLEKLQRYARTKGNLEKTDGITDIICRYHRYHRETTYDDIYQGGYFLMIRVIFFNFEG